MLCLSCQLSGKHLNPVLMTAPAHWWGTSDLQGAWCPSAGPWHGAARSGNDRRPPGHTLCCWRDGNQRPRPAALTPGADPYRGVALHCTLRRVGTTPWTAVVHRQPCREAGSPGQGSEAGGGQAGVPWEDLRSLRQGLPIFGEYPQQAEAIASVRNVASSRNSGVFFPTLISVGPVDSAPKYLTIHPACFSSGPSSSRPGFDLVVVVAPR